MADTVPNRVRQLRRPVGPDKALDRRWSANWLATLVSSTDQMLCIVEDISPGGAKLRVGLAPQSEETVTLVIASYGPIAASVALRRRDRLGLKVSRQQPLVKDLVMKAAMQTVGTVTHSTNPRMGSLVNLCEPATARSVREAVRPPPLNRR